MLKNQPDDYINTETLLAFESNLRKNKENLKKTPRHFSQPDY